MTQADQYRQLRATGMSAIYAREMLEYATGRYKGDGYLPSPQEIYCPETSEIESMSEAEYIAFLETQPAIEEREPALAGTGHGSKR